MQTENEQKDNKIRFTLWLSEDASKLADELWRESNCGSKSEFIEKAIEFYGGYISSEKNPNYLPKIVVSTLKSIVKSSEDRQNRNLYKIAVELGILSNLFASMKSIRDADLEKIRGNCEKKVRKLNGTISIEDAVEWQNL